MIKPSGVLICQDDAIGDVILSLPLCALIKKHYPNTNVFFLGKPYTQPIIELSPDIDRYINIEELEKLSEKELVSFFRELKVDTAFLLRNSRPITYLIKRAKIKYRIGTFHYLPHVLNCNRWVSFSRGKINMHQAFSRIKYLKKIGIDEMPSKDEFIALYDNLRIPSLDKKIQDILSHDKFNLIIHPTTSGNSPTLKPDVFTDLIKQLGTEKYKFFITGSPSEYEQIRQWNMEGDNIVNISGQLSLSQLIAFINAADGLVAGATGPLHISAILGKYTLGFYPALPLNKDASKWAPVGRKAQALQSDGESVDSITTKDILPIVRSWVDDKKN